MHVTCGTLSFQFNIHGDPVVHQLEYVLQDGDPVSAIEQKALHVEIVVLLDTAGPIGKAFHALVVENSDLSTLDLEHIHFNHAYTQLKRFLYGSEGVFGFIPHGPAVSDNQHLVPGRFATTHKNTEN